MSIAVELPALGESVVEGTVARWLVKEGEAVERDQPLVEITTDKVDAEIPSPSGGVIEKILVAEGDTVEVGAQLATIDETGSASAGASSSSATAEKSEEAPSSPEREAASAPEAAPPAARSERASEPRATPVARRIAEEARLDLDSVQGTGSAGRVTKSDVLRHAEPGPSQQSEPRPAAAAPARPAARERAAPAYRTPTLEEGDRVIPMSPQRKLIAEHMVYSKRTSPHVGTVAEVDMGDVVALRQQHKRSFQESHGIGLTFLPFVVYAVVRALRDHPALNASVVDDSIIEKRDINIGLAVETEKGLMAPVLRRADRLSLAGLAAEIDDLSSRARNRKLSADELRGGTFTISNPGRQGNLYGFAIINQPQVAILRMGEMVKRPVVRSVDGGDAIVVRPMMHIALSYDHRAVDGAPANGFLFRVRELLEAAEFDL